MALSYINNKEIKFGSAKPLNGVYTPGSPTREYEPLDSLGIYLNSGIPLSYGVENNRYMSMSDEFVATSQGNSYSFNQFFAAQMMLGFKLHDRFIACDTEHKIIGTEPLLHKAYLAEITEKTLDYFKIKIYEDKTRTFCIRMSSSEVPTSYVDLTNSFDENGLNLTQTDRQSFLSYYRFYPLTARDPSSRAEETLGVDYYLLPSAEGLKELSGDILSKFNAFISSDGTLTSLGNTAFAYAGDINYVPNYRGETSEAAVSAAKKAEVILGQVEEMHADINQILPKMEENLELTKQYRDEAMSTEIGTVRTDLDAEINARIEADTALSTKIEVASSVNRYEIENLKAKAEGKLYRTETVEAEAYVVDVPSSVSPYAEVQKIGGKSVVWNSQLTKIHSGSLSPEGMYSYTLPSDLSSTSTVTLFSTEGKNISNGHKLFLKYVNVSNTTKMDLYFNTSPKWTNRDVPTGSGYIYETIDYGTSTIGDARLMLYGQGVSGGTVSGKFSLFDLTLMFGAGNEPTLEECKKIFSADYYPYDAGTLKSFPVQRVKSVGKNLAKNTAQSKKMSGVTFTVNDDKSITVVGTANNSIEFKLNDWIDNQHNDLDNGTYYISDGGVNAILILNKYVNGEYKGGVMRTSFTITDSIKGGSLYIYINKGITVNETLYPQIEEGSVATDYTPYRETMLDVSSVTTDLKSVGSVHDEWSNGKVTKRIKTVDISNMSFNRDNNNYWYSTSVPQNLGNSRACISNKLSYGGSSSSKDTDRTKWYLSGAGYFELYDDAATSSQDVKDHYAGTVIQFELATPTEETVPEIDNYINVEGGGTLTFESDDAVHMPVPSTDRFVVDLTSTTEETT